MKRIIYNQTSVKWPLENQWPSDRGTTVFKPFNEDDQLIAGLAEVAAEAYENHEASFLMDPPFVNVVVAVLTALQDVLKARGVTLVEPEQIIQANEWVKIEDIDPNGRLGHLRDDAPFQVCSSCSRHTWLRSEWGKFCNFPQPDMSICSGIFE